VKFLGLMAVSAAVLFASVSSAEARRDFRCSGVFKAKTYDDVTVPRGAACTLINSTVRGDVRALKGAYFQATGTAVRGDVEGKQVQTIFIDTGSRVSGSVEADRAVQFFVFNSSVGEDIEPERTRETVQICGNTVRRGNIEVRTSGPDKGLPLAQRPGTDILIGDPLAAGCRGNVVKRGDIVVSRNFTDIEFVLRGNTVRKGDLVVSRNNGPAPKLVQGNTGGGRLRCRENSVLTASGNSRWDRTLGQCA
jgi:hypothetical protein